MMASEAGCWAVPWHLHSVSAHVVGCRRGLLAPFLEALRLDAPPLAGRSLARPKVAFAPRALRAISARRFA